ncbi:right-handed parallel beta-helix repeat-containing protein [Microbacterium sp.]|uniref:right-handed parallel beta-helix repeat-containing protein n=1 Tax=Microbacterium sp. TaxID=51671 RepID=UPI002896F277|nr:right-handed parallel beta-helix repeat-containing protein [Microbacterium sp.]
MSTLPTHARGAIAAAVSGLIALALGLTACAPASPGGSEGTASIGPTSRPTPTASTPAAAPTAPAAVEGCPAPSRTVDDADTLTEALRAAQPGDVIALAPGTYSGTFVATASGTADAPITLCGPASAVLDGGGTSNGYVFHLDGAQYWHLIGFTVTNGQKGVMADGTTGSVIEGLTVHAIGDEGIHLRRASTDNIVRGNTVSDTGQRKPKFGEGIYIGTAESNWCDISDCQPDASDRNLIEGNTISGTTSEAVDIKEGTRGGTLRGNTFDGSTITAADSWVDVKGNDWIIEGNTGVNSPGDGFQTHEIGDAGYGDGNVFTGNTATVNGPGFGFSLTPVRDNVVECSNTVSAAGEGFANVDCR